MKINKQSRLGKYLIFLEKKLELNKGYIVDNKDGCQVIKRTIGFSFLGLIVLIVWCLIVVPLMALYTVYDRCIPDEITNTLKWILEPLLQFLGNCIIYSLFTAGMGVFTYALFTKTIPVLKALGYLIAIVLVVCSICLLIYYFYLRYIKKDNSVKEFIVESYKSIKDKTCPIVEWESNLCECGGLKSKCDQTC